MTAAKNTFEALRGFSRKKTPEEHCDLCSLALAPEHPHVLQRSNGQILCACDPCAILFSHREEGGKFLRIPRDPRLLPDFEMTDVEWASLRLPIDMAFFTKQFGTGEAKALYPSPAGGIESLLSLDAWDGIVEKNPALRQMAPEVECLLVNRTRGNRHYFIAPLDQCYKLTGLIRMHWRGFSGGDQVWTEIDRFFAELRERAGA